MTTEDQRIADYIKYQRRETNARNSYNEDFFAIWWHTDDVIERANEIGEPLPTKEQARDILRKAMKNHDCNFGLTWEHLDQYIEELNK